MLISFSGLDGAGKSSLISWLRGELERRHHGVAVLHMNDHVGVYAYLRAVRDRVAPGGVRRSPTTEACRPGAGERESRLRRLRDAVLWSRTLRRVVYPLDLVIFLGYRIYLEGVKRKILIMDRYFYDTLVDVADGRSWGWLRLLERMTATPSLPVFLDVTPEESFARKGEYTVEYLRRRHAAYHAIRPWVRGPLVIVNDDLEATKRILEHAVEERLGV